MALVADVDPIDGSVLFRDAATGVPIRKVYPMGGDRRAQSVDVQGDVAIITRTDGKRESWSTETFVILRQLDP